MGDFDRKPMTFLQPLLLIALPLIAMPIVIHLMNQRRHLVVPWAAMQFLRRAKRLNTGVAKLRYWLIMAMRMAAVAGVILGLSRPLSTGWIGGLGSNDRVTLIVLDRSPSMELQDTTTQMSKRTSALERLDTLFATTGSLGRRFLLTSGLEKPFEITSPTTLTGLSETSSVAASSDIPGLLEKAISFADDNKLGAADIWVASDLQSGDWQPSSDRWRAIREQLSKRPATRLLLLNFANNGDTNFSVSATNIKPIEIDGKIETSFDIHLHQNSGPLVRRTVPVIVRMGDMQSTVEVTMQGEDGSVTGVRVSMEEASPSQAGLLEIPPDANLSDNQFHFVSQKTRSRSTVVVGQASEEVDLLALALSTQNDNSPQINLQSIDSTMLPTIDWKSLKLLVWNQGNINAATAKQLETFIESGGTVVLFPPAVEAATSSELVLPFGLQWSPMEQLATAERVESWRTDSDLLRNTEGGDALPLGEIKWNQHWPMNSKGLIALAKSESGKPLLSKFPTSNGQLFLCHTTVSESASNLKEDGVCLYIILQRALYDSSSLSDQSLWTAGMPIPFTLQEWTPANDASKQVIPWERSIQPGAYSFENNMLAVNRAITEDTLASLPEETLANMLQGVTYQSIVDDAGKPNSLAREIWRVFIVGMILFLIMEAWLSMPNRVSRASVRENAIARRGLAA